MKALAEAGSGVNTRGNSGKQLSAPAPSTNGNKVDVASSSADGMNIDIDSNGISEERFVLNGNEYVARWYAGESRGEVCFASNGQSVGMRKAKEIAKEVLTANGDDPSAAAIYTAVKALIASLRRHKQSDSGETEEAQ